MKMLLQRTAYSDKSTIGELFLDGEFFCYTLEDTVRKVKKAGETAIPAGTYEVVINYSPRFKQKMPLLLGVPRFEGVRIHAGNKAEDTEGCILVGYVKAQDFIGQSRMAYEALFRKLDNGERHEITII